MTTERETVHRADRGRVAVLELDYPGRTMNVVDERVLRDLGAQVEAALADDHVEALVLASAKPTFGAGADVSWLPELASRDDAEAFLAGLHRFMVALVRSRKPMVAALKGAAFGGALELALGARAIVAGTGATLGLPEVTLGLLPGGGGTQLLMRFLPAGVAAELLTSGRHIGSEEACALGLVHRVVPDGEVLDEAVALAESLADGDSAPPAQAVVGGLQEVEERRAALSAERAGLSPAVAQILDVLAVGVSHGLEHGLAAERKAFLTLLRSPEARAAIHLFVVESEVKRRSRGGGRSVSRLAVVGGGQMGAGIAATAVTRGVQAVVRDVTDESIDRARAYLNRVLTRSPSGQDEAWDRWSGTTLWDGFAQADAVVEAVFELPQLKKDVLQQLSDVVGPSALLATNTSAISIADLATAVDHPERFLGMHFFSPVERMPLVELITHPGTSAETAQRAAALGRQLGKVPITVGDAPGFFTSRVYARWLMEGVRLLLDGVTPGEVDAAAKSVGFPIGPLQAHDEVTLELVLQASIGQVAENVMVDRLDVAGIRAALEALVDAGVRGRRHGRGFYRYGENGKRTGADDGVLAVLGVAPAALPQAVVAERLLLAFASECFLCWDDGTLCHPDDGDIGAVLGIGFPRSLGGPFHWADEVGAAGIVDRCRSLGSTEFPPGRDLLRMAVDGGRFTDQPRRPSPFADALPDLDGVRRIGEMGLDPQR